MNSTFESSESERVDRVSYPGAVFHRRRGGAHRRNERPVFLPLGPLFDPAADQVDLRCRERLARFGGRHPLFGIGGYDSLIKFALREIGWNERVMTTEVGTGSRFGVQSQIGLALRLIGPVALIADIGKNRPDVAIEFDARHRPGQVVCPCRTGKGHADRDRRQRTPRFETRAMFHREVLQRSIGHSGGSEFP